MNDVTLGIDELADAAGLTRRAVRFYVQRGLLPPPLGLGRGRHYDRSHLERLERIRDLQAQGHSLSAIQDLLDGKALKPPPGPSEAVPATPWVRLHAGDGVEINFRTDRHAPTPRQLQQLRQAVRAILKLP